MTAAVAIQTVVSGLAVGSAYALVAIGFSLLYRLTGVLAFAHGDFVVGAVFAGLLVVVGTAPTAAALGAAASVGLAIAIVAAGAAMSVAGYLLVVRPFTPKVGGRVDNVGDVIGWVAGGLAVGLLVRAAFGLTFTGEAYAVPDPLHLSGIVHLPAGAVVSTHTLGMLCIGLVVALAVERVFVLSRLGMRMRAVGDDPTGAALVGLPVRSLTLLAFVLAGALAGLAGLLVAPERALTVDAGVVLGLKAIAACVLGGLGSIRGALLGGLAIGLIEAFVDAVHVLGPRYGDIVPLAILVLVLAIGRTVPWRAVVAAPE